MTSTRALAAIALASFVTGCPSPSGNPKVLWLAPDQAETKVKLVDTEPPPF